MTKKGSHSWEVWEVPNDKVYEWEIRMGWYMDEFLQIESYMYKFQFIADPQEFEHIVKEWAIMDKKVPLLVRDTTLISQTRKSADHFILITKWTFVYFTTAGDNFFRTTIIS